MKNRVLEVLGVGSWPSLLSRPPAPLPLLLSLFPAGVPTVAPPTVQPTPRPDMTPPPVGTYLLYAQGQQIGHLPLNGTRLQKDAARTLLSLHVMWMPVGRAAGGTQIWVGWA